MKDLSIGDMPSQRLQALYFSRYSSIILGMSFILSSMFFCLFARSKERREEGRRGMKGQLQRVAEKKFAVK